MVKCELEKISKILYEYQINNKYADEKFVYDVLDIIIKSRKIDKYINQITVKGFEKAGGYDYSTKKISINTDVDSDSLLDHNLQILHIILHECEHIDQYRIIETEDIEKNLKSQLLYESFKPKLNISKLQSEIFKQYSINEIIKINNQIDILMNEITLQRKNPDIIPSERMAEIDSFQKMMQILSLEDEEHFKQFIPIISKSLNKRQKAGYKIIDSRLVCPTEQFYEMINKKLDGCYKELNKRNTDTLLYYGLPIESSQFKK